jgi:hypothetical protein
MTKLIKKGTGAGGQSLELQPDWIIESDGFGLLTSKLTFKCDAGSAAAKAPKPESAHPEDGRLKCHKSSYTISRSGWAVITADYVGIETGERTKIQIKGDVVTGTQPIQTHKDFLKTLKGLGWDTATQSFPETKDLAVKNGLVGVKSFLTADSSVSASFYVANKSVVQDGVNMVGKTFLTMPGMEDVVLPKGNQGISEFHDRFAMLTGLNYEKYAHLYKVSFTIRISPGGYHNKVYTKTN